MQLRKELQLFNFSLNHLNFSNDTASSKNFADKQEDAICRSSERKKLMGLLLRQLRHVWTCSSLKNPFLRAENSTPLNYFILSLSVTDLTCLETLRRTFFWKIKSQKRNILLMSVKFGA